MKSSREKTIASVTLWGAAGNLLLSAAKMVAGVVGNSAAMVADAVHSLSDLVSDAVVLVMAILAGKEKDESHDYGHGKFETLATVVISLLLLVVGAELMAGAIGKISLVARGGELQTPGRIALWAALLSIAVKEVLYQWTVRVGRRVDSPAMIANAWHHRSDALSSVGAALGIGGALLFGGRWAVLDPITGALISIVIIVVAVKMALPALAELTEASLPRETESRIVGIIEAVPGVDNAHDLKTRRSGRNIIVDVHLVVDPDITVSAAHDIASRVEDSVRREFGENTQISTHIEPHVDAE